MLNFNEIIPVKIENYFSDIYISFYDKEGIKKYEKINYRPYYYISENNNFVVSKNECVIKYCDSAYKMFELSSFEKLKTFQADLKLHRTFILDKFLQMPEIPKKEPKVAFLDIESFTDGKIDVTDPKHFINAISILDSSTNITHTFSYHRSEKINDNENHIYCYNSELELLKNFLKYMNEKKFDIITGWNIIRFDIPSICFRLQEYGLLNDISPFKLTKQKFRKNEFDIYGISQLDYMKMYKKYKKENMPSYSLETISMHELSEGKSKFTESFNDLWENHIHRFIDYNRNDVKLVKKIDDKVNFIKLAAEIRNISFVNFEEVLSNSIILDNLFLLKKNREGFVLTSKVFKTREEIEEEKEDEDTDEFTGAYVKEPRPGIRNFVIDLDCESQYPSAIMYLNISPDTKIGRVISVKDKLIDIFYFNKLNDDDKLEIRIDVDDNGNKLKQGIIKDITVKELRTFLKQNNYIIAANGCIFYGEDKLGFIPEITKWIFTERKFYKSLMLEKSEAKDEEAEKEFNIKQLVFKELSVSIYGFLGFSSSRFFDIELAEAITLTGQKLIKKAISLVEEKNYEVITTDTDSLLISFAINYKNYVGKIISKNEKTTKLIYKDSRYNIENEKLNDFFKENKVYYYGSVLYNSNLYDVESSIFVGNELSKYVDLEINNFSKDEFNTNKSKFHFKNEIVAKKGAFFVKKKYALHIVYKEGVEKDKIIFKGLEVIKSDTPTYSKKYLNKIYSIILKNDNIDEVDSIIKEFRDNIRNASIEDIGISVSIKDFKAYKNETIQSRGAKIWDKYYSKDFGVYFSDVNRAKYYFLDHMQLPEKMKDIEKENLKNFVISVPEGSTLPTELKINYEKFESRLIDLKLERLLKIIEFRKIEEQIVDIYENEYIKKCNQNIYNFLEIMYNNIEFEKIKRLNKKTVFANLVENNNQIKENAYKFIILNYFLDNKYDSNLFYDFCKEKYFQKIEEEKNKIEEEINYLF